MAKWSSDVLNDVNCSVTRSFRTEECIDTCKITGDQSVPLFVKQEAQVISGLRRNNLNRSTDVQDYSALPI